MKGRKNYERIKKEVTGNYTDIYNGKTPTFDDVIKTWEDTINDKLQFKNNDEGIRITYPNGIYYLINREQVYSNRKVFSMNVNVTLNAINLTIRYLQNVYNYNEPYNDDPQECENYTLGYEEDYRVNELGHIPYGINQYDDVEYYPFEDMEEGER